MEPPLSVLRLCHRKRITLETEKNEKETQLEHNLLRKQEQLEAEVAEASEQDLQERLAEAEEELRGGNSQKHPACNQTCSISHQVTRCLVSRTFLNASLRLLLPLGQTTD
ncbi:hypothetical protein CSKR_200282 [Clonorchis sinensis]|uniref:Uncharacterized protein n=1 Tax=Clonorchis sinensis TaxID=79923 RepID=A0A8T1LZ90_CLOSI|nr:hypothetical protein CSKR_200282 [Clonorchis sinensis]